VGASSQEIGRDVARTGTGDIVITGDSNSDNWVSGGFDTSFNGVRDAFVVKLTPSGAFLWSTYLGGSNFDYGNGVAVDGEGWILVTGQTNSPGWVSGGYDTTHAGNDDAYVVKLSAAGGHHWSTYLGGSSFDIGHSIAVGSGETVVVGGETWSAGWTSGGFDTVLSGNTDAFVARLTPGGAHLWSSYLGGGLNEYGYGIAASGTTIVSAGKTTSSGWTSGGYDTTHGGGTDDGYVARITDNTRPTNPGSVVLTAIDEDTPAASISGTLASSIVTASGSTDANGDALGIAVTAVDTANGQWQYSTDGGSNWLSLAGVTATAARLLGPAHLIRFVPNANFNSAIATTTASFKTWDQTSGTAGSTGDTTAGDAYSTAAATATQSVTAVNDAPSFTLSSTLVQRNEDAGAVSVSGFATNMARGPASATDEAGQVLTFLVNVTGFTGTLAFNVAPAINQATGELTFTVAANTNGTATVQAVLQGM
jgi:hypothetical protein